MDQESPISFERLLATDPKLKAFNDTVPAGILIINLDDGQVVFSNRFFSEVLGGSGEQLLGKNWEDFFVDPEERQEIMVEFAMNDVARDFELRLRGPEGKIIWGLASLSIIPLDDEDMLLFAFTDVTRLKEIELKLEQSGAQQKAFNNTVPVGILVTGLDDGRVVYSNDFISELLGAEGDQILGANWNDFFVDEEERQNMMVEFAMEDEVHNFELRLRHKNGDTIWGLASLSFVPMEDEDLLLFAFNDVTKLKQIELKLAQSNAQQKAFNNTVPAGILVIGIDDGRVVYSNDFISELLGAEGDQILGANWNDFFVDEEERQNMMVEFAMEDTVRDFELRLRHRNGDTVWGLASLSYVPMDDEDLLLFAFNDVTRLKQVEMDLAAANDELKNLAELKNRFLGMAAHDLRTPIGAIRGMSELITTLELPENKKGELVVSITEVSDQMLELLNDLLDVTAIESGTFDLDLKPGDLRQLIQQRVELVSFNAEAKNIQIETSVSEIPEFPFDQNRLGQVIDNLLTNAIKFSPAGGHVDLSASTDERFVELCIRDYGQGISETELDKIFVPFEKLSTRPTAGEKSTGLGLAIVKRIVDAHRGFVNVDSVKGEGATFTVSLPLDPNDTGPNNYSI